MVTLTPYGIYFSPTGNSELVCNTIVGALGKGLRSNTSCHSITTPKERTISHNLSSNDLLVITLPVYAGRLPNKLLPYLQENIKGSHTPAIITVTFGNRSFDNALKELEQMLTTQGFYIIGAAAVPSEHAFTNKLATGRPNVNDLNDIERFAKDIIAKEFSQIETIIPGEWPCNYYMPKGLNGEPVNFLKAKPQTNDALCTHCGLCARSCPMGSISQETPAVVEGVCIKCQRCIKVCSQHAKHFDNVEFLSHVAMLERSFTDEKKSMYFL